MSTGFAWAFVLRHLASIGFEYAELERQGIFLVVHSISCRYHLPARFGDTIRIVTTVEQTTPARIDHSYQVFRDDDLLAEAKSTIACVNSEGVVQRIPELILSLHVPD